MNLSLDDERKLVRDTVRAFAKERVRPRSRAWDEAAQVDDAALDEGWGLGLFADGEEAPSALTNAIALEELAWADVGFAARLFAPAHLAVPLSLFGSAGEKRELESFIATENLPRATGAWIEPVRTFDLAGVRARIDASRVSGEKALVPAGASAEKIVVYAGSGEASGFAGVHAFVVEAGASGVEKVVAEEVIGPRAAGGHRIRFEGAPALQLGGEKGVDYRQLASRALVASAAVATGVIRAAAEYAADYAKERVAFGRAIARNQSIAFMIADAFTDAEAARWMTWKAAWRIDQGGDALKEASLAFRFATDASFAHADNGVQILGGHGVIRDHLAELFFRNARALAGSAGAFIV